MLRHGRMGVAICSRLGHKADETKLVPPKAMPVTTFYKVVRYNLECSQLPLGTNTQVPAQQVINQGDGIEDERGRKKVSKDMA